MAIPTELTAPEWVDSGATLTAGLDLLGLRLPVQTIGGALLDGVTTVTPSVRYMALRAWAIQQYARAGLPDSWDDFTAFAKRVESALVIGNLLQERSIAGLIGSDEASVRIDAGTDSIEISSLVQAPAATIYANPCDQLGITWSRGDKVPGLTAERGQPLADAVTHRLVSCALTSRLVDGKQIGLASRDDLAELGALVRIDQIPEEENTLLIDAVIPKEPQLTELHRIGTYAALLGLASEKGAMLDEKDIFHAACSSDCFGDRRLDSTADGWLMYAIRDAVAVTQEAVMANVMHELMAEGDAAHHGMERQKVIGNLVARIEEHDAVLRELGLFDGSDSVVDFTYRQFATRFEERIEPGRQQLRGLSRWSAAIAEPLLYGLAPRSGAGALSLALVAWIMAAARVTAGIVEGQESFGRLSYQGWRRLGLREVVLPELKRFEREDPPLLVILGDLAHRAVGQHLRIAWSRLQTDLRKDVGLLTSDGELWIGRKGFSGGRTASRLSQAIGWLKQLQLINDAGITEEGKRVRERSLLLLDVGVSA